MEATALLILGARVTVSSLVVLTIRFVPQVDATSDAATVIKREPAPEPVRANSSIGILPGRPSLYVHTAIMPWGSMTNFFAAPLSKSL